ncbi:MAG: baseplate J/gp47 family protein, partial [Desulfovibrionaceae bacterium]|nr:baseplate J/gp47 family protein [Desulfovibrionaceae bacterium]
ISGGAASAPVDAVEAGTGGNESAGVSLTLTSPVSGVQSTAAVAAGGITGGADQEADEALRARLITRIQQSPHGGAGYDYVAWALEVSGVTRAWCYPEHMGLGTSSPARGRGLKPGPVDQIHPPGRRPPPRGRNSKNSASPFLFIAIGCCLMIIQIQKTGHRTRDNH